MKIEHGPPGSPGVSQLQYVGLDEATTPIYKRPLVVASAATAAVAFYAHSTRNKQLRNVAGAIGIGLAALHFHQSAT